MSTRSKLVLSIAGAAALPLLVVLMLELRGCGTAIRTRPRAGATGVEVLELAMGSMAGMSGLTTDGDGRLWAIPERGDRLVRIDGTQTAELLPIRGFPSDLEAEALAWLEGRRFAIGTESSEHALDEHFVYMLDESEGAARVTSRIAVHGRDAGIDAASNEGIEGLCQADGWLVAALETPGTDGGVRYAAVAHRRWNAPDADWTWHRVRTTSRTGKLSALDCRWEGARLVIHAVERHYEVMHLVRFVLPVDAPSKTPVPSELVRDLSEAVVGSPNFEGLAVHGGDAWIMVDNHYGHRTGPNELVRVPLDPP